jgi:hypothetical protein
MPFVKIAEASKKTGLSKHMLFKLIKQQRIKYIHVENSIYFVDIEDFLKNQVHKTRRSCTPVDPTEKRKKKTYEPDDTYVYCE